MLVLKGLTKIYEMGANKVFAVDNISLSVEKGTFLSVVGKSGSGKSTLLHLIGGLDESDCGQIIVNGVDISKMSERKLSVFRRKNIGFVFQFFNLIPELSAKDNILFATQLSGNFFDEEYYNKLISILGLYERQEHLPEQLSGGEKQRVAIARALITKPKLLLLDEPTGNLDSESSEIVMSMLLTLKKQLKQTVVMVTHDMESASKADRMITLKNGKILSDEKIYG